MFRVRDWLVTLVPPNKFKFLEKIQISPTSSDTNTGQSTIQTTLGGGGTVGGARSTRAPRWWPSVRPWKRPEHPYSAEKLVIPLPVPHPAQIALTIYNRDTDNPIPVDSDTCKHVLRYFLDKPLFFVQILQFFLEYLLNFVLYILRSALMRRKFLKKSISNGFLF